MQNTKIAAGFVDKVTNVDFIVPNMIAENLPLLVMDQVTTLHDGSIHVLAQAGEKPKFASLIFENGCDLPIDLIVRSKNSSITLLGQKPKRIVELTSEETASLIGCKLNIRLIENEYKLVKKFNERTQEMGTFMDRIRKYKIVQIA